MLTSKNVSNDLRLKLWNCNHTGARWHGKHQWSRQYNYVKELLYRRTAMANIYIWILAFCKWFSSLALRSLWTKSKYIDCIRGTKCKYISVSLVPGMFADSMCKVSIVFEWTCQCIKLRMNGPFFQGRRRTHKNWKQI